MHIRHEARAIQTCETLKQQSWHCTTLLALDWPTTSLRLSQTFANSSYPLPVGRGKYALLPRRPFRMLVVLDT
jgi:hypothetical protein